MSYKKIEKEFQNLMDPSLQQHIAIGFFAYTPMKLTEEEQIEILEEVDNPDCQPLQNGLWPVMLFGTTAFGEDTRRTIIPSAGLEPTPKLILDTAMECMYWEFNTHEAIRFHKIVNLRTDEVHDPAEHMKDWGYNEHATNILERLLEEEGK